MEHLGAGLAALGVIGPGIGIGILAGMSAAAIGRNPDAAAQIRGLAIILGIAGIGVFLLPLGIVLYLFEVGLVATLQAFIFATLSAIYIGGAVAESH